MASTLSQTCGMLDSLTRSAKLHDSNDSSVPFGKGSGYLQYKPTGEKVRFPADRCLPYPREEILEQRNPSCDLRTYAGGLVTCHHGWHACAWELSGGYARVQGVAVLE